MKESPNEPQKATKSTGYPKGGPRRAKRGTGGAKTGPRRFVFELNVLSITVPSKLDKYLRSNSIKQEVFRDLKNGPASDQLLTTPSPRENTGNTDNRS